MLENLSPRLLWAQKDHLPVGAWNNPFLANDFWRLYQNDADGGWLESPEEKLMLAAGEVYLIPPGLKLSCHNKMRLSQFYIHFDLGGVPPIVFRDMTPRPVQLVPALFFSQRVAALGISVEEKGFRGVDVRCLLMGVLYEALGLYFSALPDYLQEQGQRRAFSLRPLLPALMHIENHLDQRLSNETLAALCGMSEDYFIRRFREAVGLPPSRYVVKCRVAMAAQRLLFTDESIGDIAERTGFVDRFYFTRVFSRQTGSPPAAYRASPRI